MSPKNAAPDIDQGEFFTITYEGNGAVDPDAYRMVAHLETVPEGVYVPSEADPVVVASAAVTQAVQSHRSGLHSPLQRDGTYLAVRPGDFLPGFGPVKRTNLDAAYRRAEKLEAARTNRRGI